MAQMLWSISPIRLLSRCALVHPYAGPCSTTMPHEAVAAYQFIAFAPALQLRFFFRLVYSPMNRGSDRALVFCRCAGWGVLHSPGCRPMWAQAHPTVAIWQAHSQQEPPLGDDPHRSCTCLQSWMRCRSGILVHTEPCVCPLESLSACSGD